MVYANSSTLIKLAHLLSSNGVCQFFNFTIELKQSLKLLPKGPKDNLTFVRGKYIIPTASRLLSRFTYKVNEGADMASAS